MWAQDFKRCSLVPVLDDINNADEFKEVLQVSAQRATLRKTDTDQVDTISKAADPGKFKDEKKWPDWEPAFVNYLSTIPGVEGVPLSYVVRANDAPDHQTDFGDDFISRSVACAPLQGAAFRADARKVHQLLMNFLVAESAEQWIRGHVNQVNGRLDMVALRNHYSGEGNASRRIATAENYERHYITRVSIRSRSTPSLTGCKRCLTSSRKRANPFRTTLRLENYSSGFNTRSSRTRSKRFA